MARRRLIVLPIMLLFISMGNMGMEATRRRLGSISRDANSDESCEASVQDLMNNCETFVVPSLVRSTPLPPNPSPCCSSVQAAQFPCICSHVTGSVMAFIDKQAVKNVLQACNVNVPSGTTCGGITWGN